MRTPFRSFHDTGLRHLVLAAIASIFTMLLASIPAGATTTLTTQLVGAGFSRPVWVTNPPGDTERLFVVEQRGSDARGRIKIIKNGATLPKAFLTTAPLSTGNEQGLFCLAFAPDYATSGRFYIHYTDAAGTTRLARYTVSANPDTANPAGTVIYSAAQPYTNHNGGWIAFGPDGFLWMALGDGGLSDDPGDRAQNINAPLGKLLRFDVSGNGAAQPAPGNPFYGPANGLDEIFCFGLRNPWRCSFDRLTGDLIIGDVGQNNIEEIDFAPADSSRGSGWNYGWRCYEGNSLYIASDTTPCGSCYVAGCPLKFPAYQYTHTSGRCSVTGGYVYRGCKIPDLQGTYFFADYCGNQIYAGRFVNGTLPSVTNLQTALDPPGTDTITSITSFSEDAAGELLIIEQGGQIWRVVPAASGVAEADMPVLQVTTAGGDVMGATTPGNALLPGITPFTDSGSRLRGVGYLRNAQIRACPEVTTNCRTSHLRLAPFDIDVTACVDVDSATLTRTFVFTNTSGVAQPLDFRDVVAPRLNNKPNVTRAFDAPTSTSTARLAQYESTNPALFVTQQGFAKGAVFSMDADSAAALVARVAADQPLTNRPLAGPGTVAMALGFDFGNLAAAATETLTVVSRLLESPPVGVEPGVQTTLGPSLRVLGPMPFRDELRLALGMTHAGTARLDVFDVRGRRVRRLMDQSLTPGGYRPVWDGRDDHGRSLGAGLYFVRLRTPDGERSVRVVRVQ